jgi:hypothetical protein
MYQMWPECYSFWFNWRNFITCTHCNVITLENDSIPWQGKSQRIDVDATSFHLLWQSFMIIKIFSRRFELDGGSNNLSKKQLNMDKLCFVRLLRLIWQIPRRHHSRTQYKGLFLSSLCYLKIDLKPSPYTGISVVKRRTLNHPSHYWIKLIHVMDMTLTLTSSLMRSMHSKKNRWCCLRVIASLVSRNSTKNCFLFWWK